MGLLMRARDARARCHSLAVCALLVAGALGLGACSNDEPDAADEPRASATNGTGTSVSNAVGPGISVADALASELDGPLLVNGFIIVDDSAQVRLCAGLLESSPPQCGAPSLLVEDIDLDSIGPLNSAPPVDGGIRTVSWTEQPVQLLGTVEGDVLTVASNVIQ